MGILMRIDWIKLFVWIVMFACLFLFLVGSSKNYNCLMKTSSAKAKGRKLQNGLLIY